MLSALINSDNSDGTDRACDYYRKLQAREELGWFSQGAVGQRPIEVLHHPSQAPSLGPVWGLSVPPAKEKPFPALSLHEFKFRHTAVLIGWNQGEKKSFKEFLAKRSQLPHLPCSQCTCVAMASSIWRIYVLALSLCVCLCVCTCVCVSECACICACVFTYMYLCAHTRVCMWGKRYGECKCGSE